MNLKIISGGQTGADTAGLIAAKLVGFETGGYMPHGHKTTAGNRPIMREIFGSVVWKSPEYPPRTEQNIRHSQVTVAIGYDFSTAGERLTRKLCEKHQRRYVQVQMPFADDAVATLSAYLVLSRVSVVNIAGNSEQTISGITDPILFFLLEVFKRVRDSHAE